MPELCDNSAEDGSIDAAWREHALRLTAACSRGLGMPLMCVDTCTGQVVGKSAGELLCTLGDEVLSHFQCMTCPRVHTSNSGLVYFAIPLPVEHESALALGYTLGGSGVGSGQRPTVLTIEAARQGWSQDKLELWMGGLPSTDPAHLQQRLDAVTEQLQIAELDDPHRHEAEETTTQVKRSHTEIGVLHTLAQNLQISRSTSELAELSLRQLHDHNLASGFAIWLENLDGNPHLLTIGQLQFDVLGLARLIACFDGHDWIEPLIENDLAARHLQGEFPDLRNCVIVPISEDGSRVGWIVGCNCVRSKGFGEWEGCLLNSVAALLGTHAHNRRLYGEHDELLLSFVRSLVCSLDAKDHYTRGHSERVALIARILGTRLSLGEKELLDLYLAGILHDIGKIGVDDRILQKQGDLTEEEWSKVKEHPEVGAAILAGLKKLQSVIPGVRHHHERFDGKGYPDGLAGEEIPLMARILSVADSFDAMGSDRPYRKGMPKERIDAILEGGAGKYWDPDVIAAYFATQDEILDACAAHNSDRGILSDDLEARKLKTAVIVQQT